MSSFEKVHLLPIHALLPHSNGNLQNEPIQNNLSLNCFHQPCNPHQRYTQSRFPTAGRLYCSGRSITTNHCILRISPLFFMNFRT